MLLSHFLDHQNWELHGFQQVKPSILISFEIIFPSFLGFSVISTPTPSPQGLPQAQPQAQTGRPRATPGPPQATDSWPPAARAAATPSPRRGSASWLPGSPRPAARRGGGDLKGEKTKIMEDVVLDPLDRQIDR